MIIFFFVLFNRLGMTTGFFDKLKLFLDEEQKKKSKEERKNQEFSFHKLMRSLLPSFDKDKGVQRASLASQRSSSEAINSNLMQAPQEPISGLGIEMQEQKKSKDTDLPSKSSDKSQDSNVRLN